jgi:predicted TIM-barrel fold metal-dependent hydrolase
MIIDFHTHNSQPDFENMDRALARAKQIGIELMGNLGDVLAHGLYPVAEEVKSINDRSLAIDRQYSKHIFSFCFLNPVNAIEFSLAEIERCLVVDGNNFVGIKLEASLNCLNGKLDPIMARAEELNCCVIHHAWYKTRDKQPEESDPADIADLARRFPQVKIICPHLAGIGKRGVLDLAPHVNVLVDTSGGPPINGALVEYAVDKLGAERLLFGSDLYGAAGRDQACQLGRLLGADISAHDKELISGLNAKRILGL